VNRRLRDERGLVGRSTITLLVLVVVFGMCAIEGGSILFTRLSLQDTADAAANAGAGSYYNSSGSFQQAEQAAEDSIQEHDPTAKLVGFQVDPSTRDVTVILRKKATTLLVQRIGFLKKLSVIRVSSTAGPPTV
jgi:uncharacterized membrane protein